MAKKLSITEDIDQMRKYQGIPTTECRTREMDMNEERCGQRRKGHFKSGND